MTKKRCRRRHLMTGANVVKQTNRYKRRDGKTSEYVVEICAACRKFRAKKTAAREAIDDLRFSRRR